MRAFVFASRNIKEILRDPLSYVFSLGLPIVMLIVFYVVFYSETAYWFSLEILTPGIAVFSFAFVMLYMALLVSKDRTTSLLSRLYTSPMTTVDFVIGYSIPGLLIALGQAVACFVAASIMGLLTGSALNTLGIVFSIVTVFPAVFFFIGVGILFGSVFSDKSAPGITSIVITLAGFMSGAWMPIEAGTTLSTVYSIFPFYPSVLAARTALSLNALTFANFALPLLTVSLYAVVAFSLAVEVFKKKMTSDNA